MNPNFNSEIKQIIQAVKIDKSNLNRKVIIGNIDRHLIEDALLYGFDLSLYKHNIDIYSIKHSLNMHSNKDKEEPRGQVPITENDIVQAQEIVYNYDKVEFGEKNLQGRDIIKLYKKMSDGYLLYIEEIRTGRKTLTLNTMRKYKNKNR